MNSKNDSLYLKTYTIIWLSVLTSFLYFFFHQQTQTFNHQCVDNHMLISMYLQSNNDDQNYNQILVTYQLLIDSNLMDQFVEKRLQKMQLLMNKVYASGISSKEKPYVHSMYENCHKKFCKRYDSNFERELKQKIKLIQSLSISIIDKVEFTSKSSDQSNTNILKDLQQQNEKPKVRSELRNNQQPNQLVMRSELMRKKEHAQIEIQAQYYRKIREKQQNDKKQRQQNQLIQKQKQRKRKQQRQRQQKIQNEKILKAQQEKKNKQQKEKLQQEKLQKERLQKDRLQKERLQKERLQRQRRQNERLQREKVQKLKLEKQRLEQQKKREREIEMQKQVERQRILQLEKKKQQAQRLQQQRRQRQRKEEQQKRKQQEERLAKIIQKEQSNDQEQVVEQDDSESYYSKKQKLQIQSSQAASVNQPNVPLANIQPNISLSLDSKSSNKQEQVVSKSCTELLFEKGKQKSNANEKQIKKTEEILPQKRVKRSYQNLGFQPLLAEINQQIDNIILQQKHDKKQQQPIQRQPIYEKQQIIKQSLVKVQANVEYQPKQQMQKPIIGQYELSRFEVSEQMFKSTKVISNKQDISDNINGPSNHQSFNEKQLIKSKQVLENKQIAVEHILKDVQQSNEIKQAAQIEESNKIQLSPTEELQSRVDSIVQRLMSKIQQISGKCIHCQNIAQQNQILRREVEDLKKINNLLVQQGQQLNQKYKKHMISSQTKMIDLEKQIKELKDQLQKQQFYMDNPVGKNIIRKKSQIRFVQEPQNIGMKIHFSLQQNQKTDSDQQNMAKESDYISEKNSSDYQNQGVESDHSEQERGEEQEEEYEEGEEQEEEYEEGEGEDYDYDQEEQEQEQEQEDSEG